MKVVKREPDYKKIGYVVTAILLIFVVMQCSSNDDSVNGEQKVQSNQQILDTPFQNPFTALQGETHKGDLIVDDELFEITDKKFILEGNLIIKNSGKVVVTNSELVFPQEYNNHYRIQVRDHSKLILDNVEIKTNKKWMYASFFNYAEVTLNKVKSWDDNIPWYSAEDDTKVSVIDSSLGITVGDRSEVNAVKSNMFFELIFDDAEGEINLPTGYVKDFMLGVENGDGTYTISAKDSILNEWGATLNKDSDITFKDSKLTLGMNIDSSEIKVSDLKAKKYQDFTLNFGTNRVKLINTEVTSWYPQAFEKATLDISYSDLADLQWNSGSSHVIVRDSTSSMVFGRDSVVYEIYDSKIEGDVIATENSKIYLNNTRVDGDLKEVGSGKIYVDDERIESINI